MALTIRPTPEETKVIESATNALGLKSMSKGMIAACGEMLALQCEVSRLKRDLYKEQQRAESAERAIKDMQCATSAVMNWGKKGN